MSSGQTLVFGVLWLTVLSLGALVLLLYREVDRAYAASPKGVAAGLLPGVALPDLEVVKGTDVVPLPNLRSAATLLLVFVKQACEGCESLLESLSSAPIDVRLAIVVLEGRTPELRLNLPPTIEVYEAAYPDDAARSYGIRLVPLAYVARQGQVVSTGSPGSLQELVAL